MKLFGNKRNAARIGSRKDASATASSSNRSSRLSGVQKGCLLMAGSVFVLFLTVFAVYKSFVKPVDLQQKPQNEQVQSAVPEEEKFSPPTRIEVETKVDEETGEEILVEVEVPLSQKTGFYNILIAGTDDDGVRTDTIMIGRLNTADHTVALLSIPRDTLIEADYQVPKINAVYGKAGGGEKGMEALKNRLAKLLGFEVNGYVLVDLAAFVELVDLVDGVEFHVPQRMYYNDPAQELYIDLQEGLQTLDGQQAMGLVRYRKGYASQDIMRTQVQQDFMRALAKKCLSVSNLTKLGELSDLFVKYVLTDLSVGNIAYFGQELLKCDLEAMFTYTLEGEGVDIDGVSYWALYLNKTLRMVNEYFNPYDTDLTAEDVRILSPEYVRAVYGQQEETKPSEEQAPQEPLEEHQPHDGADEEKQDAADTVLPEDPFAGENSVQEQPETLPSDTDPWTDPAVPETDETASDDSGEPT